MEQLLGRISEDGLEGSFGEHGRPSCTRSQLEYFHRRSVHDLLWQFIPVRNYSNTERILATPGLTPLSVNLESMTAKPKAGGGRKNCVAWKVVKAVYHCVHTAHRGFFYRLGRRAAAAGELPRKGCGAAL